MPQYYATTAYQPGTIPDQPPQKEQGYIQSFAKQRLPWGSTTSNIAPLLFFKEGPELFRGVEQQLKERAENPSAKGPTLQELQAEAANDELTHQHLRYTPYSRMTRFWLGAWDMGKVVSTVLFPVGAVGLIVVFWLKGIGTWLDILGILAMIFGPTFFLWGVGHIILFRLPSGFKTGRPEWEFDRQTGMVTKYHRRKSKTFSAPFYEWDAYVSSNPMPSGVVAYQLYLAHRYQDHIVDLSIFAPVGSTLKSAYAAWDFMQNYMDVSQPLPDVLIFEEFRHLDPTTAVYDQQTDRNPRYWIDMDETEWQSQRRAMAAQIDNIIMERPNLMNQHVTYA